MQALTAVSTPRSLIVPATVTVDVQLVPSTPPAEQDVATVEVPRATAVPGAHTVEVQLVPSTPPAGQVVVALGVPALVVIASLTHKVEV